MAWMVELLPEVRKELAKFGNIEAKCILKFLHERVGQLENPRSIGKPMKGSRYAHLWRYRSGDYRVLCEIQDAKICILVVRIGNRREIYK